METTPCVNTVERSPRQRAGYCDKWLPEAAHDMLEGDVITALKPNLRQSLKNLAP
jgi:hypothetical protein